MKEMLVIDDDVYVRREGRLIYVSPPLPSALSKETINTGYEGVCSVFSGDENLYTGKCQFKLKQSKYNSNILIFKIPAESLREGARLSRIEIEVPSELARLS